MMETILNLGMNDKSVVGLANKTKNARFAYDSYRRFIMTYASTAMGLSKEEFESTFEHYRETKTRKRLKRAAGKPVSDTEISAEELADICDILKKKYKQMVRKPFPQDPW